MKKTFLLMFLFAAAAAVADNFLYWMIDQSTPAAGQTTYAFDYATVREAESKDYLCLANGDTELGSSDGYTTGEGAYSIVNLPYSGIYMFELWTDGVGSDKPTRAAYAAVTASLLSDYIYSDMSRAGETPYVVTAAQLVPEPTGGLLMLLGFAMLGLCRKRTNMKNALVLAVAFATLGTFAAQNNLIISFNKKTSAPDTYADGSEVPSGELYALVWTPRDTTFAGIAADGTCVDGATGEIVSVMPRLKNEWGYFAPVGFQVDAADVASRYANGTWQVYLLDTRMYGEKGAVTVGSRMAEGRPIAVNASSPVADAVLVQSSGASAVLATLKTAADTKADAVTAVPADAPQPEITGVEVVDGKVRVKVAQTVPYLQYNLATGERPDAVSGKVAESPKNGAAGGAIELVAPVGAHSGFYRVNRN